MRDGWQLHKLGDVLDVKRGGSPRPISKYITDDPDGLNWIKISDATASDKYIYKTKQKITADGLHKTRLVEEGDFLLSNSMSFGRPYIMKTKGCIHDGWLVLKNKGIHRIDSGFLYHLLSSPIIFEQFNSLAAGSTVRNLNISLVSSVKIPVPPLEEQKQIVAILDQAFAAIDQAQANIQQNIQNAQDLFQSKLNQIFSQQGDALSEVEGEGWEEKSLGEVCIVERGSSPRPIKKFITEDDDGVNWVKIGDVNVNDKYVYKTRQKITKEGAEKSRFVDVGDFILSNSMSYGRPYIMKIPGYIHDGWFVLRLQKGLDSDYFWQLLSSPVLKTQFENLSAGAIVKNISGDLVKKAMIHIPSIEKQKKIVLEANEISELTKKLEKGYRGKFNDLDELKKSLLQKAFSGELTQNKQAA